MVFLLPKKKVFILISSMTTVLAFGQTTGTPSLTRGTANTASAQITAEATSRILVVPQKKVDLTTTSVVESMFSQYSRDAVQFGYSSFAGPVPAVLPRGRTPEPFVLGPGDLLTVLLWGDPVDLGELTPQFSTKIDGDGTFFYPPVGQVRADGLLRSEAEKSLIAGLAKKYKRFDLKLQVNPQRVFLLTVAGLVGQPGSVMVDSWTSLPEVLAQAGGIEKNGTLRSLKLVKADGKEILVDLYELLVRAHKLQVRLEEGDMLWVGPIGKTAALVGQVKIPGIFELLPEETFTDLLAFAGGYLPTALGVPVTKVTKAGDAWVRSTVSWKPEDFRSVMPQDGDLFTFEPALTLRADLARPGFIKVSGEVGNPGFVAWSPELTLGQVLERAGGVLSTGNSAGLVLTRAQLVGIQRDQITAALANNSNLVISLQAKLAVTTDPAAQVALGQEMSARIEAGDLLTQNLKDENLGRIQIDILDRGKITLQPGDTLSIPKDNGVVLVLGEVYNPGNQVWKKGLTVRGALEAVGGISVNGSSDEVYVLKATGRVESVRAKGNFLGMSSVWGLELQSGDVVYAPTKRADTSQFWPTLKELLGVLSQTTGSVSNVFVILKTLGVL